ncbi:hypothetical protein PF003_g35043 [Phytophthora fragariae]|uniref:Uncharacterized protein n=1 Tax=Phytophthora fragariae TaxID=53985 RepID=A0A6A3FSJ6_9STRA|nr:hypothetical protein PF003_g35043 [Phytophthora fragariae]KAE8944648.1 hypothetical protein PF009_g5680 [Phytophthora fragariae]
MQRNDGRMVRRQRRSLEQRRLLAGQQLQRAARSDVSEQWRALHCNGDRVSSWWNFAADDEETRPGITSWSTSCDQPARESSESSMGRHPTAADGYLSRNTTGSSSPAESWKTLGWKKACNRRVVPTGIRRVGVSDERHDAGGRVRSNGWAISQTTSEPLSHARGVDSAARLEVPRRGSLRKQFVGKLRAAGSELTFDLDPQQAELRVGRGDAKNSYRQRVREAGDENENEQSNESVTRPRPHRRADDEWVSGGAGRERKQQRTLRSEVALGAAGAGSGGSRPY